MEIPFDYEKSRLQSKNAMRQVGSIRSWSLRKARGRRMASRSGVISREENFGSAMSWRARLRNARERKRACVSSDTYNAVAPQAHSIEFWAHGLA